MNKILQISTPYNIMIDGLNNNNIQYNEMDINPNVLKQTKPYIVSKYSNNTINDKKNPIWVDKDLNILDGHYKWVNGLSNNSMVYIIKLNLDFLDSCKILNKIQDIFEYKELQNLEEIVSQDTINFYQDDDTQFLNSLESSNMEYDKNPIVLYGYRKKPIKENSQNGNFFLSSPIDGFDKYQIEFDNLFDMDNNGISYKNGQNLVDILSKFWFPNVNFKELNKESNINSDRIKERAIILKAKSLGFDGIKLNNIIWGLK